MKQYSRGFTIPEIFVVIGIIAILFGITTINLFSAQHKASVSSAVAVLIADIKNQQTKAMVGSTEGRAAADIYGVHFAITTYTLFHSSTFNPGDLTNFTVNLDSGLQITNIKFPNSNLLFSQGSGKISGFVNGSNTFTVSSTLGTEQKTITVNKYGVITSVQ